MNSHNFKFSIILILFTFVLYSKLFDNKTQELQSKIILLNLLDEIVLKYGNSNGTVLSNTPYCLNSDYEKLQHPDTVFQDFYAHRFKVNDDITGVISKRFFDSCFLDKNKQCTIKLPKWNSFKWKDNVYFTKEKLLENNICILQKEIRFNHMSLDITKYKIAQSLRNIIQKAKSNNATNECLQDLQFQSISYKYQNKKQCFFLSLNETVQCKEMMSILNNSNMTEIKFIMKKNMHMGKGNILLDEKEQTNIQQIYDYGINCGKIKSDFIIQEFANNPILYEGYKLEFRFYFLIFQSSPLIIHMYNDPSAFRCFVKYSATDFKASSHICNPYNTDKYYEQNKHLENCNNDLFIQILVHFKKADIFVFKTLKEWGVYFNSIGINADENYMDKEFFLQIEKRITYILSQSFVPTKLDPRLAQFIAVDALIDRNMNLQIIDLNFAPSKHGNYPKQGIFYRKLHQNLIKLFQEYTKKKLMKLKALINKLKNNISNSSDIIKISQQDVTDLLIDEPIKKQIHNYKYINTQRARNSCSNYLNKEDYKF